MANLAEAGKVLSDLGASKGGLERAKQLTASERSKIALNAAKARWNEPSKHKPTNFSKRASIFTLKSAKRASRGQ